jgi:DNA topoisomerase-1
MDLTAQDPYTAAKLAGLHYSSPERTGLMRRRAGRGFCYVDMENRPMKDRATLRRIRSLVIPPAWTNVWISSDPSSHIQAVGRDARGRKQYRYHPLYRQIRDENKFDRLIAFGEALPVLRAGMKTDLAIDGIPRKKVLAAVVRLLETTSIRVGNEEYASENGSFGLTTLKSRHVAIFGRELRFHFRGKSGKIHDIALKDSRLARVVRQCQCIPGYELFQYVDDVGARSSIHSGDVNEYLREILQADFTAKDFRTWNGTCLATRFFHESGPAASPTEAKRGVVDVVKRVAEVLGNRPATCKKYYIHPAVIEAYENGTLFRIYSNAIETQMEDLKTEEVAALAVLRELTPKAAGAPRRKRTGMKRSRRQTGRPSTGRARTAEPALATPAAL